MFAVKAEERIYLAPARRPGEASRAAISVALVVATYALFGASLVYEGGFGEAPAPPKEIPVEIVVEPPPPPPPPPPPLPPPPAAEAPPPPPVDLSPAYDAPRAGTAETDTGDKDKPAPPPPAPAAEDKSADRASGAEAKAEAPKPEATPTPEPTPTDAPAQPAPPLKLSEGEVPPPAPPPPAATEAPSPAPPAPAAGKAAPSDAPLFASVPDLDFGGAAMKSPVSGGSSRAKYMSILYGLIMPHFHQPRGGRASNRLRVVFSIDGQGRLKTRYISEESGWPELDRAAMEAVAAASPFPRPPPGLASIPLILEFGDE